jgi:2-dehydropantoate 2-reductase
MGQVPENLEPTRYLLVGDGRVARHMARYLDFKGISYASWSRKLAQSKNLSFESAAARASVVIFLIRDDVIEEFITKNKDAVAGKFLIHFSGSLVSNLAYGMHPLMTFGPEFYELKDYESIPFVTDSEGPAFQNVFPELKNPAYAIPQEKRPLYHALCVLAGNFTTLLWSKAKNDFEKNLELPSHLLNGYARKVLENVLREGDAALTGPLARRDSGTIEKNLAALKRDPYASVYRAFVEAHLQTALTKEASK